ncbi:MAG: hypothetical protein LAN63_09175 [Acidobacteriia bacterium]|nr:hypothetical protein [Terriglobia bacterium]
MRALLSSAAVLMVTLAAAETYITLHPPLHPTVSGGYYVLDDVLGTVPARPTQAHATEFDRGKLIYDVTYTIGSNGLRIAPPPNASGLAGSILFFGCSFTFGEGVQDDETMPYQVGIQSSGRYQIYNFAFHGYGPEHMLAAIESGKVHQVVETPPRYAIYQVLPDHVARVAGKIPYGKHNPRYQLDADGTVHLHGHFDDGEKPPSVLKAKLEWQLRKAAIYQMLKGLEPPTDENDIRLLLATIRRSRDLLVAEYPGIEFHVILWPKSPGEETIYRELQEGFRRMNIPGYLVENIFPDYDTGKYWLDPDDRHPNALANRLLAKYVVTTILSSHPEVQPPK